MDLNDICCYFTTAKADRQYPSMDVRLRRGGELVSLSRRCWRDRQDGGVKRKFTDIMCWRWCGREESPQAFGSAGGYPLNCHQATGMMGAWTRPRLLHERYKRIQMYGSILTGKLPSHQRDPMEGDCLTEPSASWACQGGGAPNPAA